MDKVKCKCECTCDECGAECNDIVYSKSNIPEEKAKLYEENAELKAENEKLKTDIAIYKGIIDSDKEENERLKEEITKLSDPRYQISKVNEGYYNRMNTYKQALQEIRDIAKEGSKSVFADEDCDKILAKINEVIGVE